MKKKAEQTQPFLNPQITGLETFPRLLHLGRSIASTNGHGDDSECTANVLALAEENLLGTDLLTLRFSCLAVGCALTVIGFLQFSMWFDHLCSNTLSKRNKGPAPP